MGVSNPKMFGKHLQGSLTDKECQILLALREDLDNDKGVSAIENIIYDLPQSTIETIMEYGYDEDTSPEDYPTGTLRNYQTIGASFMFFAKSCLIGDSVGLGKTAQVAGLYRCLDLSDSVQANELGNRKPRMLFLGEKAAVNQLRREMIRFTGEYFEEGQGTKARVTKLMSMYDELPNMVANHAIVKSREFQSWIHNARIENGQNPYDIIVVDESSILSNSTTQMYKSFKELVKGCNRVILLNATPFENNLESFYNQLDFLDPRMMPTKKDFTNNFTHTTFNGFMSILNGYKNQDQFKDMIKLRYLPRTRKDLGGTFKNCTAQVVQVPLTRDQSRLMMESSMHRMIYDAPWGIDSSLSYNSTYKLEALWSIIQDIGDNQILIYAHYIESQNVIQQILTSNGITCAVLNGDTPPNEAESVTQAFVNGEVQVFVTNVQKSLNFSDVDYCIFYNYNPNPNKMVQFEGRITRKFDIENKHLYIILTEGKEFNTFNQVIKDRATASRDFSSSDFSMVLDLLYGGGEGKAPKIMKYQPMELRT